MKFIKWLLALMVTLILLVTVYLTVFFDPNDFKPEIVDAVKNNKKSIILTHEKNSCILTIEKINGILKNAVHYSKKVWHDEINKLGIMNVCEQRIHRAIIEYGKTINKIDSKKEKSTSNASSLLKSIR